MDVVLSGHHHSYQRTCPVYHRKCRHTKHGAPGAPIHVCLGNGGADFYDNGFAPTPKWVDFEAMTTHGYARIHVNGSAFALEAVNSRGDVFDEFVVHKKASRKKHHSGHGGSDMVGDEGEAQQGWQLYAEVVELGAGGHKWEEEGQGISRAES